MNSPPPTVPACNAAVSTKSGTCWGLRCRRLAGRNGRTFGVGRGGRLDDSFRAAVRRCMSRMMRSGACSMRLGMRPRCRFWSLGRWRLRGWVWSVIWVTLRCACSMGCMRIGFRMSGCITMTTRSKVVSLFDYTGVWSTPYRDSYDVIQVDIQHGSDVYDQSLESLRNVHGVLAAPPCTDFANSGARWFADKDNDGRTEASIALVQRTMYLINQWRPAWWVLENPVGRIQRLVPEIGECRYRFDPCEFGEPYTKRTCLWGLFELPTKGPYVEPLGNRPGQ